MSYLSNGMICCAKPRLREALYISYVHTVYARVKRKTVSSRYPEGTGLLTTVHVKC
jgi:hypothetical protein